MTDDGKAGDMDIRPESTVRFFDLRCRPDGEDVVVGRPDTGDFVQLPAVGWHIIERLRDGMTVLDVERESADGGIEVDAADFVGSLEELGFIRSVDGVASPTARPYRRPSLPWIRPEHVRWLFHPVSYAAYALVVAAGLLALIVDPAVRPSYRDVLFSSSTSLVLLGSTAIFLVVVAAHETAHLVSARACDVPARISFGTRLYSLVAQTDVSGMWVVSRRERVRTYLAGIGLDLVLVGALVLIRAAPPEGRADTLCGAVVVFLLVGVAGQFQLFMRTDIYFVVADLAGARNLFDDATVLALQTARRWTGRDSADRLAVLNGRERRVVRWYAWVMVVGTGAALLVFAVYLLPALVVLLWHGAERFVDGVRTGDSLLALDGALTVAVEAGTQLVVIWLLLRSRAGFHRRIGARMAAGGS